MWALNALAYLIFALFCLLSNQGFNWWRDPQSIGFAYIHAIFAVQSLTQLIFVLVNELRKRKIPLKKRSYLDADSNWVDLVYYANSMLFWIICGLYVLCTALKPGSQETTKFMLKSSWNSLLITACIFRFVIDLLSMVSTKYSRVSESEIMYYGIGQVVKDMQYIFISLFVTGTVSFWNSYLLVFIWIILASVLYFLLDLWLVALAHMNKPRSAVEQIKRASMLTGILGCTLLMIVEAVIVIGKDHGSNTATSLLLLAVALAYGVTYVGWHVGVSQCSDDQDFFNN